MDQLTLSLSTLVAGYRGCFRAEVFRMFGYMLGAWIVCLGQRTISRVWETTGLSKVRDHSAAFRLFSEAAWNWDEVCRLLLLDIVALLVPGMEVWLAADDTLCHKRGATVAFGGIFLDAVLSSRKHKNFRFGNNWVTVGVVVKLPFRSDRYFCLNVMWRVFEKQGDKPRDQHRSKPQLAAEMITLIAGWLPGHKVRVVADDAYVGQSLLKNRASNVDVIGPLRWDAALSQPLGPDAHKGCKKGDRLPSPKEMLEDARWKWERICLETPKGEKTLQVKVVRDVCWYTAAGNAQVMLVLIRDPKGTWRDEVLLSTDVTLAAEEIINGYCRRWSVEVAYADAKGWLGFHDPQVRCASSVQRAHPMACFVGSLVVLWYATLGHEEPTPERHRPWYRHKPEVTFSDMLGTCRYHLWRDWLSKSGTQAELDHRLAWLLEYLSTAA